MAGSVVDDCLYRAETNIQVVAGMPRFYNALPQHRMTSAYAPRTAR
jgi:hypothetical protein